MEDKKKYNGVLTLSFLVNFNEEDGSDITSDMILKAIQGRVLSLMIDDELIEACGAVEDLQEND